MDVLFLGYAVSSSDQEKYKGLSVAGNKMQLNVLRELNKYEDIRLKVITIEPAAPFPKQRELFYRRGELPVIDGVFARKVPFVNMPIIKQFIQTINTYNLAKKMVSSDTVVFSFNVFPQIGLPMIWLKKRFGCEICTLLADLPIDDARSKNRVRNAFRKLFDALTKRAIKECDRIVALNKTAVEEYAPGTEYIVVEGGYNGGSQTDDDIKGITDKVIVYSGALTEYSGVMELVGAMKYVTDGITLHIYGGGYLESKISELSENAANIEFKGKVSNKEMLEIQKRAYLLVNPRPSKDPIARVTFPSKMFEYMTSGRPVLSTNLNGLTDEYKKHIIVAYDETPRGFAKEINRIFELPPDEIDNMASEAKRFILEEKNWTVQGKKIHDFLCRV